MLCISVRYDRIVSKLYNFFRCSFCVLNIYANSMIAISPVWSSNIAKFYVPS